MSETTISQIQTHIEEIEKRIKTLSLSVTASSQLNAIKLILDEMKVLLEQYQSNLDYLTEVVNLNKQGTNQAIGEINDQLTQINDQITLFDERLDELETNGGGNSNQTATCEQIETTNWYTKYHYPVYCTKSGTNSAMPIYFYCEPTDKVVIKARIRGSSPQYSSSCWKRLTVNDTISTGKISYTHETDVDQSIEIEFYPTKRTNKVAASINMGTGSSTKFYDLELEIYGRNVTIMNRDVDLRCLTFNNTCYLTRITADGVEFLEQTSENLDLSQSGTCFSYTAGTYSPSDFFIFPNITSSNEDSTAVVSDTTYGFAVTNGSSSIQFGDMDFENLAFKGNSVYQHNHFQKTICNNSRGIRFDFATTDLTNQGYLISTGDSGNAMYEIPTGATPFVYNGETISDVYDIVGVNDNSRGDGCTKNLNIPYIIMHKDRLQRFYPCYNSTYYVDLGYGTNAEAYLQSNLSINVYITRFNCVYKYVLTKQPNDQYEVVHKYKYTGITKIIETLDDKVIIKKDGDYSVVKLSDLSCEEIN